MEELNPEQKRAVYSKSSHIVIIAGPGTGKTKTLVARIEKLNKDKVASGKILAITFTNKAADQMRYRLSVKGDMFIGTFHGLALHVLNLNPKIITPKEQLKIVTRKKLNQISKAKNNFQSSEDVEQYNQILKKKGLLDFDDLLINLFDFLKKNKLDVDHILIDEFQDTSPLQYEILKLLNAKNYFVIGDPNQSIYSFRGGDSKVFDNFYSDFPNYQKIVLHTNYRSAIEIVDTYNKIFPETKIVPDFLEKGEVVFLETQNEYSEAKWIHDLIKKDSGGADLRDASNAESLFSDYAVLYRNHRFKNKLQEKFLESGIPFQIVGEDSIFEDEEITPLIEQLKSKSDFNLRQMIEAISNDEKRNIFNSLVYEFVAKEKKEFIKYLDTLRDNEYYDHHVNSVTFLTLHAAKGLEFKKVIMCACEDEVIPGKGDIEEEKRLFYVGLSRAKIALYLTKAIKRNGKTTRDSRFTGLLGIKKTVDIGSRNKSDKAKKYKLKKAQKTLFNLWAGF